MKCKNCGKVGGHGGHRCPELTKEKEDEDPAKERKEGGSPEERKEGGSPEEEKEHEQGSSDDEDFLSSLSRDVRRNEIVDDSDEDYSQEEETITEENEE